MIPSKVSKVAQAELCDLLANGYRLVSHVRCLDTYVLRHLTNGQYMSVEMRDGRMLVRRNNEIVKIV